MTALIQAASDDTDSSGHSSDQSVTVLHTYWVMCLMVPCNSLGGRLHGFALH
ncbi:hypothetical protein Pat9b_4864 (plasmid) [Pantoea sp. At-9b]|nr:hypothetical protein Pat9b_4864 [Pantoea sp. At-9b]